MNNHFKFEIIAKDKNSKARVAKLNTPHGVIQTPNFLPVATQGSIKSLDSRDLSEIGIDVLMSNTYHLHLRPGEDIVRKHGGLHKFMNWNKPLMTDSGGFQVFSLGVALEHGVGKLLKEEESIVKPRLNKITEKGVEFQSHIDGSKQFLSPESSIAIQEKLGADLIIGFDDLESPKYSYEETKKSLEQTNRWLLRSKNAHKRGDQLLYGVTHGGKFEDLRVASARFVNNNFYALALGGAHASKENMYDVVSWTVDNTGEEKPKHMLGVGEIDDIFNIVERGIDTFDCVVPTRLARTGFVFVNPKEGNIKNRFRIDIQKSNRKESKLPLDKNCGCEACKNYTRGYIHHLLRARELLSYRLITYHNLYFFNSLMKKMREAIEVGKFLEFKKKWF